MTRNHILNMILEIFIWKIYQNITEDQSINYHLKSTLDERRIERRDFKFVFINKSCIKFKEETL